MRIVYDRYLATFSALTLVKILRCLSIMHYVMVAMGSEFCPWRVAP